MGQLSSNLIDTLRESILVIDYDLRVRLVNHSFCCTFCTQRAEVEDRYLYELGNGQWNMPALRMALQEIMAHDTPLENFVVEQHFPQIGYKIMLLNARRVESDNGAASLILLAIEDVTERRQVEATIQEYVHKLEWSNRELEDFAYIASHDLQEPLRAIQAFSDRLQRKYAPALDEQGLDYLLRIQKAAGRMRQLISDLLAYSRVTTQGKLFERVSLTALAHECIADLAKRLEETGGRIEVGDLPSLEADPVQMRQLMQNLFDNGLKFHRADEPPYIKISAHNPPAPELAASFAIPLANTSQGALCYLVVQDNGIGFEEKYKERIFSPFERLNSQSQYPGTGIGLAVCRRIVERHGGRLTAQSVPGQGSTFWVVLPQRQPEAVVPTVVLPSDNL